MAQHLQQHSIRGQDPLDHEAFVDTEHSLYDTYEMARLESQVGTDNQAACDPPDLAGVRAASPDSLLQTPADAPPAVRGTWHWEILNVLFSIACVVAMGILLGQLDGKSLSIWAKGMPLSPNAVIAILSTASKASLIMAVAESLSQLQWLHYDKSQSIGQLEMFDDASRGPWGALKFFWRA